jgi:signal transduction histidine kinase/ligand-binding sensor domain-containing protein
MQRPALREATIIKNPGFWAPADIHHTPAMATKNNLVHAPTGNRFSVIPGWCLIVLILAVFSTTLHAQSNSFRHVTPRDGLPSGYIRTILQDDKGFIWVATNNGIGKHDGFTTQIYRHDTQDPESISGNQVYDMMQYNDSTFVLATNNGLSLFNPATEKAFRFVVPDGMPGPGAMFDLLLLDEHDLWMAANSGLYHVDMTTIRSARPNVNFFPLASEGTTSGAGELRALAADTSGILWVGTASDVYAFDRATEQFVAYPAPDTDTRRVLQGAVWAMHYNKEHGLLVSSTTGLAVRRNGSDRFEEVRRLGNYTENELRSALFQSITEDSSGKIWLGTSFLGAIQWDMATGTVQNYRYSGSTEQSIASNDVHYAYEDRDGHFWFGYHNEGISIMYSNTWNYHVHVPFPDLPANDPRNSINHVYADDEHRLWAVTNRGIIRNLGTPEQQYFPVDNLAQAVVDSADFFTTIHAIAHGKVYVRYENDQGIAGYVRFDEANASVPYERLDSTHTAILVPLEGVITEGFLYAGVFDEWAMLKTNLASGVIERIDMPVTDTALGELFLGVIPHAVIDGELYIMSYKVDRTQTFSLDRFVMNLTTGEVRARPLQGSYPTISGNSAPYSSRFTPGVVFMNTDNGIVRIDNVNNTVTLILQDQTALLRESSLYMAEDVDQYLWLTNFTGVTRADPIEDRIESIYDIPREIFISAANAHPATLPSGEIIFPGVGAYLRFDPANLERFQPSGRTLITGLQAGTAFFDMLYNTNIPVIRNDQNSLTFSFIGLDHRSPGSVNYRYRIQGSENDQWISIGVQRSVFLPNLQAGTYTFEVQSGSRFGAFESELTMLTFIVRPPWWNTIPAYILYALLLGLLIVYVDRVQRRKVLVRERERVREKELAQAKEIEMAYTNLKAAQEQLVQQEKLASLGQLTAGIAHEIKNPLNFVTNFSDLSLELLDELREDLRQGGDWSDDANTALLLVDIEQNLRKIYEHGTRADSIVKSMLQHSRGGSGVMEPANINAVIKEFVNLAFHGMRASKQPINVDIDLDLDETIGNVPLITEDFSRVILNVCNNAFDAMREKSTGFGKAEGSATNDETAAGTSTATPTASASASTSASASAGRYQPKLTVRTRLVDSGVQIVIEDNGPGIPAAIKDQILQPFFTTKKGTQGTGLGLSITHDIIKSHGGILDIQSEPGRTAFAITLRR